MENKTTRFDKSSSDCAKKLVGITAAISIALLAGYLPAQAQNCMKDATDGLAKSFFFASGDNVGEEYDRAFTNGNNASDKWYFGGINSSVATPNWIGVNFGSQGAKTLTGYLVSSANDLPERNPRDWQFQGSNNGSTWFTLDTRAGQTFSYAGQSRLFSFSNTTPYLQYRLLITETFDPTSSEVQIGEIELYEKVCLEGGVTDQGTPLSGITIAMMGETYSVAAGGGAILRTTITDANGHYQFGAGEIPDGQFSLIVQPPVGYQILSNTKPFFRETNWGNSREEFRIPEHFVTYDGSITFQNHLQLAQSPATTGSIYWDDQQNETYLNRFIPTSDKSQLNFNLKQATVSQACVTLNGTPNAHNLITVAQNGTFGTFAIGTGSGSYVRSHPGQPGFSKDFTNTLLYNNQGFVNPANTAYTYYAKANQNAGGGSGWGAGVLILESVYTVTSYIGTLADLIDANGDPGNNASNYPSLINSYNRGWRKTYGATTGDVYDKFLLINGAGNDAPLFAQSGLSLKGGQSYLFSFDGKHGNSSYQGVGEDVTVPYNLRNASNTIVASGTLTLPRSTSSATDAPDSPWERVFATLTPPSDGTYTLQIDYSGGGVYGNDFYIDNISLRELSDYGDNPISYGAVSHGISADEINATCDPKLLLGDRLDVESAYPASVSANADNQDNVDDEDGITFPTLQAGMTSYSVSAKATNLTTADATLFGWIDWDHSGTFELSERVSAIVPQGSSGATIPLTWNAITTTGPVYARFRLSSSPTAANPNGFVIGGEVEDYLIDFQLTLSGTIFNDANGLNPSPTNTVDGTVVESLSATALHANLFTDAGVFVATIPVDPSGNYNFSVAPNSNYAVTISTTPANAGSTPLTSVSLPAGWVNTGENVGVTAGSDGAPNGILAVTVANADVTAANFGVDHEPDSDDKTGTLPVQPTSGQFVPLDASIPTVPNLTGTDPEDQSGGGTLQGRSIAITSLPTNGELWYNGSKIEFGADNATPPSETNPYIISSLDPSLLQVRLAGSGYSATSFDYAYIDAAGVIDPSPATYTLSWENILPLTLAGTIFNDANGINPTPANTIDGTPLQSASGSPLHANLFTAAGVFVATVPVDASGNYIHSVSANTDYLVTISTIPAGVGSTPATSVSLPAGWINTGENVGAGTGSDGSPNGILAATVGTSAVTNVNFGIDLRPDSDPKSAVLPTQPSQGQFFTLDGSAGAMPMLTGSDPEDFTTGGSLEDKTVAITGLPDNGELWYNGVKIAFGADNISAPSSTNPFLISNFDPSLLQIHLAGTGYTSATFHYAYIDSAGAIDLTPAPYTISWEFPLPVVLIDFQVNAIENMGVLSWSTSSEVSSDYFDIQRSLDGIEWTTIGRQSAARQSSGIQKYGFNDGGSINGTNYYRLKMVDSDGSFAYSTIRVLLLKQHNDYAIFPNPVSTRLFIQGVDHKTVSAISIINSNGTEIYRSGSVKAGGIDVSGLATGLYTIFFQTQTGRRVLKVMIAH